MKRNFILITLTLLSLSLYANDGTSRLSISVFGDMNVRVMVDGFKYRASNNQVMINDLNEGYHTIKVYQLKNNRGGNRANGGNSMYNYQVIYDNRVFLKPRYHMDIVINRFGRAFTDEQPVGAGDRKSVV
jgi:hypothetical protein